MALEEMKDKRVMLTARIDKTLDTEQSNKMIEAKITLTPHPEFVGEVMQGNKQQSNINEFPIGGEETGKKKV